jgi:hypothetical protein
LIVGVDSAKLGIPNERGTQMSEQMDDREIAGVAITIVGAIAENFISDGYCDPLMYNALRATANLAERLGDCEDLVVNLKLTIMEAGEVMNRMIDELGLPVEKNTWESKCDHDHETD